MEKHWYLICYDIRLPKRWMQAYKILKGRGEHLQYSIFRLFLNKTQLEELRWKLTQILDQEDDLLIIRLCPNCAEKIVENRGTKNWSETPPQFEIL